jgi:hypothetical protein
MWLALWLVMWLVIAHKPILPVRGPSKGKS